ncbi:IclR family transcriptional regulator [Nocardioides sp. zg-DK7169]|uniref:IclR family transcriptional regulator n=1 Tax=Nocardioides sp. zg-DK7169 TaxID=2736600 RepID=UPI0015579808
MNATTPPVDVVGRTGTVLRALAAHEPGGATTTAVAQWCGLARPTTHRLLSALAREGLADRDPDSGRWLLGPELFFLGSAAAARYDVTSVAHPFVRRLADATGESAFFSARRGDETICLVREDGSFPIRSHVLSEGVRFPLGVASAGMVVLAHLPDTEIEELLARTDLSAAWGEQHRAEEVRRHVALTRAQGYSVNPGLIVDGSWGLGAAVFDADGRPRWALSITAIEQRLGPDRRRELGRMLLREAHELSRALQRRGPSAYSS